MQIISHIFRAYDIRGIVGKDFDSAWVRRLGQACGSYFIMQKQYSVVVGCDCRPSSPAFHDALVAGILSTGIDVISVGMVPTPALYFAVRHFNKNAGIMITASHNPSEYNGFKIWSGLSTLYGEELQNIKKLHDAGIFSEGFGVASCHDILPSYIEAITSRTRFSRPIKVVVDGGNGAGGPTLVRVLRKLGAEVVPLYCEPDGTFPNHHPDPIVEANMRDLMQLVQAEGAELGIGLDGDADRLGIVDRTGRLLNGDELLAIFARDLLDRQPGALVLGDVKCSDRLFTDIAQRGGQPIMCVTGHSVVKAKMLETSAPLAGELSGHMFFAEQWFGFDDALYAAALLLDYLTRSNTPLTELPGWPVAFSTREIQLPCPDQLKATVVSRAQQHFSELYPTQTLDGARVTFPHGWGLVRASNTQPVLVLRFEAASQEQLVAQQEEMVHVLEQWIAEAN